MDVRPGLRFVRDFCHVRRLATSAKAPPRRHAFSRDALAPVTLSPIGVIRSPYLSRFGTPRQASVPSAMEGDGALRGKQRATAVLYAGRGLEEATKDLEGFERVWLITMLNWSTGWTPLVKPPRSRKGRSRMGLLATRAPDRPNPIGLSAVELVSVRGLELVVCGVDLLDGTPILDIKPYVPYCDAFPSARSGWLDQIDQPVDAPDYSGDRLGTTPSESREPAGHGPTAAAPAAPESPMRDAKSRPSRLNEGEGSHV